MLGRLRTKAARRWRARRILRRKEAGLSTSNLVWVLGSGRTGSTWVSRMLEEMPRTEVWFEPWVGAFFDPSRVRLDREGKHFILSESYRKVWLNSIRNLVMDGARARFPWLGSSDTLFVKEPGGSGGSRLLMESMPQSSMVLLIRDPRDVVASWLDAFEEGSWLTQRRGESHKGAKETPKQAASRVATMYMRTAGEAAKAFDEHAGRKSLVRYEDLIQDTAGTLKRMYSELGLQVDEGALSEAVKKHSWSAIPDSEKGEGKFYRRGESGGWREDLSAEQVEVVEKKTAPILDAYY